MNALQTISILLEFVVVALGIMLVVGKKKMYGWCIALTFILYIFYDLANLLSLHISQETLDILFFMATKRQYIHTSIPGNLSKSKLQKRCSITQPRTIHMKQHIM